MPEQTEPACKSEQECHRVVPCAPGCGTTDLLAEATRPVPPPADRGAILAEAIAVLETHLEQFFREWPNEPKNSPWACGWKDAVTELRAFEEKQRADDEPRAVTHARAVQEIRAAARHLYADAGIRVLAALDDAQVCNDQNPETGDRCNRHHGHFGFHRQVVNNGVYTSWVGEVPGTPAEEEHRG